MNLVLERGLATPSHLYSWRHPFPPSSTLHAGLLSLNAINERSVKPVQTTSFLLVQRAKMNHIESVSEGST